jgi:plastocyanin
MQSSKMKQVFRIKIGMAALIAIASVMILAGTLVRTAAAAGAPSEVSISNYAFTPVPLTVKVGTTVTWINHDDDPHAVDSTEGKFKSKALDTGSKFEFRFTEPGEYPFTCRFHPKMTGKIIVQP